MSCHHGVATGRAGSRPMTPQSDLTRMIVATRCRGWDILRYAPRGGGDDSGIETVYRRKLGCTPAADFGRFPAVPPAQHHAKRWRDHLAEKLRAVRSSHDR